MDRVDIYEDGQKRYVKIIDYKSSFKELKEKDIILGTQLQLLTYLDILLKKGNEIFGGKSEFTYLPGGVYYFEIKSPKLSDVTFSSNDELKKLLLKEFKLEGVTNNDLEVIEKFDKKVMEQKESDIIKVKIKKNGDLTEASKVYSEDKFNEVIEKVNFKIKQLAENIYDGNIDIDYDKSSELKACNYCNFSAICKKDK